MPSPGDGDSPAVSCCSSPSGHGTGHNQDESCSTPGRYPQENFDSSVTVLDDDLQCPICLSFLCDPLTIPDCQHSFCRICLLQSTHLAPDGRSCPLCRGHISIRDPRTHEVDASLEAMLKSAVGLEVYAAKLVSCKHQLEELVKRADTQLPIFAMPPGTRVGQPVALHFFEPRYKILIRRSWEGSKLFVFCGCKPRVGARAHIVRVERAAFLPDGRANIIGVAVQSIVLGETWVEEGTGGLAYTKCAMLNVDGNDGETSRLYDSNSLDDNEPRRSARQCVVM